MIQLDCLRHGEVQGGTCFRGHTDDPLTPTGLQQMQAATNTGSRWDQVISSPLQRCATFATAFAQQYSLPLQFDDRLTEMHFGDWEGRTLDSLMGEDPDALTNFWNNPTDHPPPGAESLLNFQARVLSAWNDIIQQHPEQRILLITHGGVIRILLCHVQQHPINKLLEFDIKHGSLHHFYLTHDGNMTTPTLN